MRTDSAAPSLLDPGPLRRPVSGADLRTMLLWILRIGAGLCFVGHGAFGILGKEAWLPYFSVVGIEAEWALRLMPLVGAFDIAVGLLVIARPRPVYLTYMAGWALWTAALRPLAGEPVWELLERAGNYGVPFALLLLFLGSREAPGGQGGLGHATRTLRWSTALLLLGHGGLGLFSQKALLAEHYAAIGLSPAWVPAVGAAEILLAIVTLRARRPGFFLGVLLWKVGSESLFLVAGAPVWEFVERAGSYAAPLALFLLLGRDRGDAPPPAVRAAARRAAPLAAVLTATMVGLADPVSVTAQESGLLERLREGDYVLVVRHTHTDRSRPDRRPVDLDDPSTQRNLSERGRREAGRLGRLLAELEIPVGEVRASPYFRTSETAELAFGAFVRDPDLAYSGSRARFRTLLEREVPRGGNRVLVTHRGVFGSIIRGERVDEGDTIVVRPSGDGFEVVGVVRLESWEKLGARR